MLYPISILLVLVQAKSLAPRQNCYLDNHCSDSATHSTLQPYRNKQWNTCKLWGILRNLTTNPWENPSPEECTEMGPLLRWSRWHWCMHVLYDKKCVRKGNVRNERVRSGDLPRFVNSWNTSGIDPLKLLPSRDKYLNSSSSPREAVLCSLTRIYKRLLLGNEMIAIKSNIYTTWLFWMSRDSKRLSHLISAGINPNRLSSTVWTDDNRKAKWVLDQDKNSWISKLTYLIEFP